MDAQEAQEIFLETKEKIETKYKIMVEKIFTLKEEITNAACKYLGKTQEWIDKKVQMLTDKVNEYTQIAKDWLEEQMNKLKEWLKSIQDAIKEWIQKQLEKMIIKLAEMIAG